MEGDSKGTFVKAQLASGIAELLAELKLTRTKAASVERG